MTITALALTEAHLAQAERLNPKLNALIAIRREAALADARASDRRSARGETGLLEGMTISVKDNIDIAGEATTAGARHLAANLARDDAPVVARLRKAGAVIMGKANMAELAFGSRSFSAIGGQCRNPWNLERIPGGSSGGSAVSVASDMCIGSLGTDTGGSVRLPACFNGVSGLRPTMGRVPIRGVVPLSEHNDTVGPIARSVDDVARIFAVVAGYDALDAASADVPLGNFLPTLHDGIAGRRIGIPRNHFFDQAEPAVVKAVMDGARVLEQAGAVLVDVEVPLAGEAHIHQSRAVFSDVCHVFMEQITSDPPTITASVLERMRHGLDVTGVQYAQSLAFRNRLRVAFRRLFANVDMLLSPTSPMAAPLIDDGAKLLDATRAVTRNTYVGAMGALPGLSVPCGFTPEGLPVGLQLEAGWWQEPLLFRAGIAFQQRTDFHLQKAPLVR